MSNMENDSGGKLRLCIISNTLNIGGGETQLLRLCQHLDPDKISIEVVYYGGKHTLRREYETTAAKVTFMDRDTLGRVKFVFVLASYLRRQKFDVVHCWRGTANQYGGLAAILAGQRCILTGYRNLLKPTLVEYLFDVCLLPFMAGRMVNSNAIRDHVGGIPKHKVYVVPNSLDISEFDHLRERQAMRTELNIPVDADFIVSVGRLIAHKKHEVFIEAARQICLQGYPAHFALVGEGPHRDTLERLVRQSQIESRFHFFGSRRDVPDILAASDISVCTSFSEGCPNVVLEAMMIGVPMITSDNGGGPELLGHAEQIVPVGDANALADKIIYLLEHKNIASSWALRAQQRSLQYFNMNTTAQRYYELIKHVQRYGRRTTGAIFTNSCRVLF